MAPTAKTSAPPQSTLSFLPYTVLPLLIGLLYVASTSDLHSCTALPVSSASRAFSSHFSPILSLFSPENDRRAGSLKLCPPGGQAFLEAFDLACPMRRRRKRRPSVALYREEDASSYHEATLDELMNLCCYKGCDLVDIFPYCGPFSDW